MTEEKTNVPQEDVPKSEAKRILLVDDDYEIVETIRAALQAVFTRVAQPGGPMLSVEERGAQTEAPHTPPSRP